MVIEAAIVKNDISATVRDASISAVFRRPRSASGRLFEKCQLSFIFFYIYTLPDDTYLGFCAEFGSSTALAIK